jgi:hypothetical protein
MDIEIVLQIYCIYKSILENLQTIFIIYQYIHRYLSKIHLYYLYNISWNKIVQE